MPQLTPDPIDRVCRRLALVMAVGHEARTHHGPALKRALGERADAHGRDARALASGMALHPHDINPSDAAALAEAGSLQTQHEALALGDA